MGVEGVCPEAGQVVVAAGEARQQLERRDLDAVLDEEVHPVAGVAGIGTQVDPERLVGAPLDIDDGVLELLLAKPSKQPLLAHEADENPHCEGAAAETEGTGTREQICSTA